MKKKVILTLTIFIFIFIVSCRDHYSIEQTLFIDSIGLDYNKETKKYSIYYHLASSQTLLTNTMGGQSTETIYSIGHVEANGIYEGFNKLYRNSIKNLTLTHVQSFILTFDFVSRENLEKICSIVKTYDYISPNFYVFATQSKLSDIYSLTNPENISPFFSIITGNDFVTSYDLTYFTEIARSVYEEYITTKLIVIDVNNDVWQNNDEKITSVTPSGALYLKKDDKKLYINQEDFKAITVINHDTISIITEKDISYTMHNNKIKIKIKNNKYIIKITGTFYATNIDVNNRENIRKDFIDLIENEFNKLIEYSQINDFDILNLQDVLYRHYHFHDYEEIKEQFDYKNIEIEFDVNYKLLS